MNSFRNVALGNTKKSNSMLGYNIPVVAPAVTAVSNAANNAVKVANNAFNTAAVNVGNAANSLLNSTKNAANSMLNIGTATATAGVAAGIPWLWIGVGIIFITLIVLATVYYNNIKDVLANVGPVPAPPAAPPAADFETPLPPGSTAPAESIVEKVLPSKKEVFSVQSNRYRYQDAEPLCKALGAELATYDQVKEAWDKGADWCNYGWSKGQMALYPTQKETWEKLQNGPEAQRLACGRPGINGGHFDNPDLRFGVNCYGAKPDQDDHDLSQIDAQPPLTPAMIDFDKKVADFRSEADHIGVLPFKGGKWSE
jgi:hypothetical protein